MDKWVGKIALVTGASVGIGRAIAKDLSRHGMTVVACARNFEQLTQLASEASKAGDGDILPHRCDLTTETEILELFSFIKKKVGALHVCVNNAGLAHHAPLLSGCTEEWKNMIDVNMLAPSIVMREAVTLMRENGVDDGHVVNLNSMSGHRQGSNAMFSATKFAVAALTEGLRRELRGAGSRIRVSAISPGFVESEFSSRLHRGNLQSIARADGGIQRLKADDIAAAVRHALCAPLHVDYNDMYIRSVEQKF